MDVIKNLDSQVQKYASVLQCEKNHSKGKNNY